MYLRAKNSGTEIQFYDFYEWIHNDISKTVYDRNISKTGLELKKKVFQPQLNQINFTKPSTPSIVVAENRDKFGLPKSLNIPVAPITSMQPTQANAVDEKVKTFLGGGLKLTDLKSRQNLAGLEALKKKVQDGTAPSHTKLYTRRATQLQGANNAQLDRNLNDLKTQLRKIS